MLSPKKTTQFNIHYYQFLDETGTLRARLPDSIDAALLTQSLRQLILTRTFDTKAIALQRTGQLGTYPSSLGEEAVSVGTGLAMHADDVLCPYYRDHGAFILRGIPLWQLFQFWGGDERGMDYQGPRKDFPICVPIATHAPHAVGVAYAMKLRNEKRVAVFVCGDGATSKGDFYESKNQTTDHCGS